MNYYHACNYFNNANTKVAPATVSKESFGVISCVMA